MKGPDIPVPVKLCVVLIACSALAACSAVNFMRGGIYRDLNEDLTIVRLTEQPQRFLDKQIVFSVRYYKKGELPCPLGEDYTNFIIADRVSYITLNKVWIKKDKAAILGSLKEMETVVMKARVFKVDEARDPNLEALEIVRE
ncbi:MAG: hypothetical protein FJ118_20795 [Deltaproteobacteria bacterium]|nr:hypothetical protein [Deltaproteobacteria bacterium]